MSVLILLTFTPVNAGVTLNDPLFDRALLHASAGRNSEAITEFTAVLQDNPSDVASYFNRALCYSSLHAELLAIRDFTIVISSDPSHIKARYYRGRSWDRIGYSDSALQDYEGAIDLDSNFLPALSNAAILYVHRGMYDSAECRFLRARESSTDTSQPDMIELNNNYGSYLSLRGRDSEAVVVLRDVVSLDSTCAAAQGILAVALMDLGDDSTAYHHLGMAIQHASDSSSLAIAYFNRGIINRRRLAHDSALSDYSNAIIANPQYWRAYLNRGNLLSFLGRNLEARDDWARSSALNGEVVPINVAERARWLSMAESYLAAADSELPGYADSWQLLNDAAATDTEKILCLALLHLVMGHHKTALDRVERIAITMPIPSDTPEWNVALLGNLLLRVAQAAYSDVSLRTRSVAVAGWIYVCQGRSEEGYKLLRQASDDGSTFARDRLSTLSTLRLGHAFDNGNEVTHFPDDKIMPHD